MFLSENYHSNWLWFFLVFSSLAIHWVAFVFSKFLLLDSRNKAYNFVHTHSTIMHLIISRVLNNQTCVKNVVFFDETTVWRYVSCGKSLDLWKMLNSQDSSSKSGKACNALSKLFSEWAEIRVSFRPEYFKIQKMFFRNVLT